MTIEELKRSDKVCITPVEAAKHLNCNDQVLRVTAKQRPEMVGFPFTFVGNRMKIPRVPFLRFLGEIE